MSRISRRRLLTLGAQTATAAAIVSALSQREFLMASVQGAGSGKYAAAFKALDKFVEQYMRDMDAPGMTFGLANREGVLRTTTYAYSDVKLKQPVNTQQLFHIGSISKSFAAICLLQLREAGKLDLDRPIAEYLPWFKVKSKFAPITVHHLLTHSAGLPGNSPTFLPDPAAEHEAANPPGQNFHYCNMGFDVLGHLIETLDGVSWADSVRKRVLNPLGMNSTEAIITAEIRDRTALSYVTWHTDRPNPRYGKMNEASELIFDKASGSIASTPNDMALYAHALLNRGKGKSARILSEESFALFSKPHIKAEEFGPTASYGYGIAVDTMDGHQILRHTGGMVSFASALQVDMDAGIAGWASINAMQGYRPNPVVVYALKSLHAVDQSKPLPTMPASEPPTETKNAADYAGTFTAADGRKVQVIGDKDRVYLMHQGKRVEMESKGGDVFLALHPDWDKFDILFGRAEGAKKDEAGPGAVAENKPAEEKKLPAVIELAWGADWYVNEHYSGAKQVDHPKEWEQFTGHYRNDSPWEGSFRVVLRKGKLWLGGEIPLEAMGDPMAGERFRLQDEPDSPEWIWFGSIVNGKARHCKLSGQDYYRIDS
jgi:D-alanyl-D-alanine carboxypeptidase